MSDVLGAARDRVAPRASAVGDAERGAGRDDRSSWSASASSSSAAMRASTRATSSASTFLTDIVATDYLGWAAQAVSGYVGTAAGRDLNLPMTQGSRRCREPKPKRFSVSYHLLALRQGAPRCACRCWLDDGETVQSVVLVWPAADWYEREQYDLMGIRFDGHPNLTRPPDRGRLGGPSAAQGLPDRRRAGPLLPRRMSRPSSTPAARAAGRSSASRRTRARASRHACRRSSTCRLRCETWTTSCRSTSGRTTRRRTACCG